MRHLHRVSRFVRKQCVMACSDTYPIDRLILVLYLDCLVFPSLEAPERLWCAENITARHDLLQSSLARPLVFKDALPSTNLAVQGRIQAMHQVCLPFVGSMTYEFDVSGRGQ